jgi:Flp pilus assembly protein TadG
MQKIRRLYDRFSASTGGIAAVEVAMICPMLAVLCLAAFDGARAIAIYMKVRSATYDLAAITNQYTTIQSSDMTSILGATSTIMAPYSITPAVITISQISINGSSNAKVTWSSSQGGTARTIGSSISVPSALAVPNSYLIFAELTYAYTPIFGFFSGTAIQLSDNLYVTPRSSTCIVYVSSC